MVWAGSEPREEAKASSRGANPPHQTDRSVNLTRQTGQSACRYQLIPDPDSLLVFLTFSKVSSHIKSNSLNKLHEQGPKYLELRSYTIGNSITLIETNAWLIKSNWGMVFLFQNITYSCCPIFVGNLFNLIPILHKFFTLTSSANVCKIRDFIGEKKNFLKWINVMRWTDHSTPAGSTTLVHTDN